MTDDARVVVGEVVEVPALDTGLVGYVQVVRVKGEGEQLVRVLPGRFAHRLGEAELRRLVAGRSRCTFLVQWFGSEMPDRVGVLPVPADEVDGGPVLSARSLEEGSPHAWAMSLPGERELVSAEEYIARFGEPSAQELDRLPAILSLGRLNLEELIAEDISPGEQRRRREREEEARALRSPRNPDGVEPVLGCRFDNGEEHQMRASRAIGGHGFAGEVFEILGLDGSVAGIPVHPDQWWLFVRTNGEPGDEELVRSAVEAEGGYIAERDGAKIEELMDLIEWGWYADDVRSGHLPLSAVPTELSKEEF